MLAAQVLRRLPVAHPHCQAGQLADGDCRPGAAPPGVVKLRSANPLDDPYINLNFFSNQLDVVALRKGIRFVDDILQTGEGMKDIVGEDYPWPMPRDSDEAMNKLILERSQTGLRKSKKNKRKVNSCHI